MWVIVGGDRRNYLGGGRCRTGWEGVVGDVGRDGRCVEGLKQDGRDHVGDGGWGQKRDERDPGVMCGGRTIWMVGVG